MTRPGTSRETWNSRYRDAALPLFGTAPSEFLRGIVGRSDFDARSALFLADGDGRNSRFLAARGAEVFAIDFSRTATEQARRQDIEAGLSVSRVVADLATWRGFARRFGAVILIALHSEEAVRRRTVETGLAEVDDNGWFVLEGFAASQADSDTMGPSATEKLYDLSTTLSWIPADFEIYEALEGRVLLAEGTRHDGPADMVRILARRRR
ncbi:MAG: class I SAM-dependent methyltransferase [Pseudomonadota bacterium]